MGSMTGACIPRCMVDRLAKEWHCCEVELLGGKTGASRFEEVSFQVKV